MDQGMRLNPAVWCQQKQRGLTLSAWAGVRPRAPRSLWKCLAFTKTKNTKRMTGGRLLSEIVIINNLVLWKLAPSWVWQYTCKVQVKELKFLAAFDINNLTQQIQQSWDIIFAGIHIISKSVSQKWQTCQVLCFLTTSSVPVQKGRLAYW